MNFKKKHDIAISVAEEDLPVAEQIAKALTKEGISYYLYTEHRAANWGKHILRILLDIYGAEASYVLMITSKVFEEKYWVGIERQIGDVFHSRSESYVLQLKIDNTHIDGLSKYVVFEKWNDNPEEIADIIKEKLKLRRGVRKRSFKWLLWIVAVGLIGYLAVFRVIQAGQVAENGDETILKDTPAIKQALEKYSTQKRNSRPFPASDTFLGKAESNHPEIFIKGGQFAMGNFNGSKEEQPPHTVTLDAFFISKTEVTIEQFSSYCASQNIALPAQPYHRLPESCPIVNITWDEAAAYCKWVGGRLPTEAEWEYAAGGGLASRYSGSNNASKVAVYGKDNSSKVGTKDPNVFGLYDMTGNVAEWCYDWFDSTYYSGGIINNPVGPATGKEKVVRGGAYNSLIKPINLLSITYRGKELPNSRKPYIGFRVVWDKNYPPSPKQGIFPRTQHLARH